MVALIAEGGFTRLVQFPNAPYSIASPVFEHRISGAAVRDVQPE